MTFELLDIGKDRQYYVMDETYVEYQLITPSSFIDNTRGVYFYISNGKLPSGLTISNNGLIYGVVSNIKDYPDNIVYDYNFTISITDGYKIEYDEYAIKIVGPEYLNSNSDMEVGTNIFTADVIDSRPILLNTNTNLGTYKINDFVYVPLFTQSSNESDNYSLRNQPDGLSIDDYGILNGFVHQNNITQTYNFSVVVSRTNQFGETNEIVNNFEITFENKDYTQITWNNLVGHGAILEAVLGYDNNEGYASSNQIAAIKIHNSGNGYQNPTSVMVIPTNGGSGAVVDCVIVNGSIRNVKIINSGDGYITPPLLMVTHSAGTIYSNTPSTIHLDASSIFPTVKLQYSLHGGKIPPLTKISPFGELIGVPGVTTFDVTKNTTFDASPIRDYLYYNRSFDSEYLKFDNIYVTLDYFNSVPVIGSQRFDNSSIRFDSNIVTMDFNDYITTFDKKYDFSINATDRYGKSVEYFSVRIVESSIKYNNIFVKPLLDQKYRTMWRKFINNNIIFQQSDIYRIDDTNFGINSDLRMLVYPGIEKVAVDYYINAINLNNKKKRFVFGKLKTATAYNQITNDGIYEVIYIEMSDPMSPTGESLPLSFESNGVIYNPSSITTWGEVLRDITYNNRKIITDNSLSPLWMQPTPTEVRNFTLGVPICYCKMGTSSSILIKINNYINDINNNFDFNNIDYTVDRYFIQPISEMGEVSNAVFNNYRTTV